MCMLIGPDYHLQVWDIDQSCLVYQSAILSGTSHLSFLKTYVAPIKFLALLFVNLYFFYIKSLCTRGYLGAILIVSCTHGLLYYNPFFLNT